MSKWYFGRCPVFAPGMPLATIRKPAGFKTFPAACAFTKEPSPGQFAGLFVISKNRSFEPIFGTNLDLFRTPGPISGWRKNKRFPVKQPHQGPKIVLGLHWRARKCQIWRSARCAMWTFMGFAGEGHRSRLSCEHTPGSGRLGWARAPNAPCGWARPSVGAVCGRRAALRGRCRGPRTPGKWSHVDSLWKPRRLCGKSCACTTSISP